MKETDETFETFIPYDPVPRKTVSEDIELQPIQKLLGNRPPWFKERKHYLADPLRRLEEELSDFHEYISETPGERKTRISIYRKVKSLVEEIWPDAKMHLLGSCLWNTCLPGSCVDIVVLLGKKKTTIKEKCELLNELLKKKGLPGSFKEKEEKGIAVLVYLDPLLELVALVSFNFHHFALASESVAACWESIPGAKKLFVVLKTLLETRGLTRTSSKQGLPSLGLAILVLSFLKTHPLVQRGDINPERNCAVLLLEFCELYGRKIDYMSVGIGLDHYWPVKGDEMRAAVYIYDPADGKVNLARTTSLWSLIRLFFSNTHDILLQTLEDGLFWGKRGSHTSVLSLVLYEKHPLLL